MNTINTQFTSAAETITLTDAERSEIRMKLRAHMEAHPVHRTAAAPVVSPWSSLFSRPSLHRMAFKYVPVALIAGVILTGTGVSYAAEDSLPGDLLYPIKINFNEELAGVFLRSPVERAMWEAERAERRISEAAALALRGGLTDSIEAQIGARFATHIAAAAESAQEIAAEDPVAAAEVTTEVESALESQSNILAQIALVTEDERDAQAIVEAVRAQVRKFAEVRESAELALLPQEAQTMSLMSLSTSSESVPELDVDDKALAKRGEEAAARMKESAQRAIAAFEGEGIAGGVLTEEVQLKSKLLTHFKEKIRKADALLADGKWDEAYRIYRLVLADATKADRLEDAGAIYKLDLSLESLLQEGGDDEAEVNEAEKKALTAQSRLIDMIAQVAAMLEGEEISDDTEARFAEAQSLRVRGDVALSDGEWEDARRLYTLAIDAVQEVAQALNEEGVEFPASATTSEAVALKDSAITHTYKDGAHVYGGAILAPVCASVESGARVAESFPEQITIELTVSDEKCGEKFQEHPFAVEAAASKEARLMGVLINDASVKFELVEEKELNGAGVATSTGTSSQEEALRNLEAEIQAALEKGADLEEILVQVESALRNFR